MQNNGQWRLAADDSVCNHMERRYFLRISLMDMSGSCDIVLNNEQVCQIFLTSAPPTVLTPCGEYTVPTTLLAETDPLSSATECAADPRPPPPLLHQIDEALHR